MMTPEEQKIALKYFLLGAGGLDIDGLNGIGLLELPDELVEECCRQRAEATFAGLD